MGEEGGQSPGTKQGKANQSTGGLAWGWGVCMHAQSLSRVRPCVTLWAAAHLAPLSMGFSRQEYWTGLPCSPQGDLPDSKDQTHISCLPALAGGFFTPSATWEA